jgi:hypothetical protein
MTARRDRPEQAIQKALFDHIAWRAAPGVFAFHCPLGGWRSAIEAKIFKSIGTVAGIPDVLVVRNGQLFALELKPERGGRLSDAQHNTHQRMREAGAVVSTAYGIDEAIAQLEQWNLLAGVSS